MTDVQREQNLMLVYAVEGYANKHRIPEREVFEMFKRHRINDYFRKYYGVLHTQDFDEDVYFAEDIIGHAKDTSLSGALK